MDPAESSILMDRTSVGKVDCLPPLPLKEYASLAVPGFQRWLVTPTCRQRLKSGQVEQRGATPVQTCLPNGTSRSLISTQ